MIHTSRTVASGAAALCAAAALAACGSSSPATTTAAAPAPATTAGAASTTAAAAAPSTTTASAAVLASIPKVVIGSYKTPQDGTLITGAGHRSLYVFASDEKSTTAHQKLSTCYGACTKVWPPVLATKLPTVSGLAKRSLLGLSPRKDGTKQVTYNGLPLYYYVADAKAGQSVGNHLKDGFGLWIGMLPTGKLAPDGAN